MDEQTKDNVIGTLDSGLQAISKRYNDEKLSETAKNSYLNGIHAMIGPLVTSDNKDYVQFGNALANFLKDFEYDVNVFENYKNEKCPSPHPITDEDVEKDNKKKSDDGDFDLF